MQLPEGVKPEDVMFRGLFYRNPTHLREAERASSQSDIVKTVHKMKRTITKEVITFDKISVFPGMVKIRELEPKQIESLMKNIARYRPNTFGLRICFGETYPNLREVNNYKVSEVSSTRQISGKEVGERIAEVFKDKNLNIVDFVYIVENSQESTFSSRSFAFATDSENYTKDEYFKPFIEITYLSNM